MKKLIIAAAALTMLSTASFAANKNDGNTRKLRHDYNVMQTQMVNGKMAMQHKRKNKLTNFERLQKNMRKNELSSH